MKNTAPGGHPAPFFRDHMYEVFYIKKSGGPTIVKSRHRSLPAAEKAARSLARRKEIEKESALRAYSGWSLAELRADCKDYGIADERSDWKKMSRDQLAVWLYKHKRKDVRTYWEW